MNDWRQSAWGDEVTLEYGKAFRNCSDTAGSVRVFGANGPIDWTDTALALDFDALQRIWPSTAGDWPWDPEAGEWFRANQPLLAGENT